MFSGEEIFRMLTALAFGTAFLVVWAYRRRAQAGERYDLRHESWPIALALRVGGLGIWLFPPTYVFVPSWVDWAGMNLPSGLRWAAAGVALFIVPPLVAWAQRHLGHNVTTTVVTKEDHQLVTSGPYRWIRHPLYTFGLLFFLSIAVLSSNWIPLIAELVVLLALFARLPKEEARLAARFGDEYRAYAQRTGRFLPKISLF